MRRDFLDILVCKLHLSLHFSSLYNVTGMQYHFYHFYFWTFKEIYFFCSTDDCVTYIFSLSTYLLMSSVPRPQALGSHSTNYLSLLWQFHFSLRSLPSPSSLSSRLLRERTTPHSFLWLGASGFYATNIWMPGTILSLECSQEKHGPCSQIVGNLEECQTLTLWTQCWLWWRRK